jgi:hypothetical protein
MRIYDNDNYKTILWDLDGVTMNTNPVTKE